MKSEAFMAIVKHTAGDQRQAERVVYRDLKVSCDGCIEVLDRRSPDLTPQGMFINTLREFPVDAELTLRFELVRTGTIVQAVGEVRYCLPGVGVGVQFVDLSPASRAAIERELEQINK
jgi:PilZ domain